MLEYTRNESVSVGTASQQITKENPNRKVIHIKNISGSDQVISLQHGAGAAVANSGVVLADGESWTDSSTEGYDCFKGVISAIASVAGTISIMER